MLREIFFHCTSFWADHVAFLNFSSHWWHCIRPHGIGLVWMQYRWTVPNAYCVTFPFTVQKEIVASKTLCASWLQKMLCPAICVLPKTWEKEWEWVGWRGMIHQMDWNVKMCSVKEGGGVRKVEWTDRSNWSTGDVPGGWRNPGEMKRNRKTDRCWCDGTEMGEGKEGG